MNAPMRTAGALATSGNERAEECAVHIVGRPRFCVYASFCARLNPDFSVTFKNAKSEQFVAKFALNDIKKSIKHTRKT